MTTNPDLRPAQDISEDAPLFFLHFAEEDVALEATLALLRKVYRVEVTPPRPELSQWDVYSAGVPTGIAAEEAAEILGSWVESIGGSYSGCELPSGADFDDVAEDWAATA